MGGDSQRIMPRYPIYVLSKDRFQYERATTARVLAADGVPFTLAVETPQVDDYRRLCDRLKVPSEYVVDVGFSNTGMGAEPVRNWATDTSRAAGDARHWQLDDNCRLFYRLYRKKRIPVRAGIALRVCEDLTDRYENVGLSGLNYGMFVNYGTTKPLATNVHVYSCILFNNEITNRWRGPYNSDTDMCLQVLGSGWCTILLNVFSVDKRSAFTRGKDGKLQRTVQGGNSDMYQADGRLRMARSLERLWPGVVTTKRRFQRPQHVVHSDWRRFDTPLRLRPDVDLSALPKVNEYGMGLREVGTLKSPLLRDLMDEYRSTLGE